jgi:hypothetical protein
MRKVPVGILEKPRSDGKHAGELQGCHYADVVAWAKIHIMSTADTQYPAPSQNETKVTSIVNEQHIFLRSQPRIQ